jgi:methylated-DNA-[protein]-cysteine S-methyltransferase
MIESTYIKTPFGFLLVAASKNGIEEISFKKRIGPKSLKINNSHLKKAVKELGEYFEGARKSFTFKLDVQGTEFQKKVWKSLQSIPYGELRSYGEIATAIKKPGAARAVGMANNTNRLPIVIPCHRVVGAKGDLVGFAAGLPIKEWLLRHEGQAAEKKSKSAA